MCQVLFQALKKLQHKRGHVHDVPGVALPRDRNRQQRTPWRIASSLAWHSAFFFMVRSCFLNIISLL